MQKYKIIYEDQSLFVVWKASGIPVQSARHSVPDIISLLGNRLLEAGVREPYLALVNRLDQPVEGLFLIARQERAAAELGRQISGHTHIEKLYQALICGKLHEKNGTLVDYLQKDGRTNISKVVPRGTKDAKRCALSYEVTREYEDRSLLNIRLQTGRHHQIRVQLAHAGTPIAGDRKYGQADDRYRQLCLCACELAFPHPETKEQMRFRIEPTFSSAGTLDV